MRLAQSLRSLGGCVAVAAIAISALACAAKAKGSKYVGRWECSTGGKDFLEIKTNNGAFLVSDGHDTYPASLDDNGTLVLTGIPLIGAVPLPIDEASGELISSGNGCKRLKKSA